jgi:hypothetical protein
MNQDKNPFLMNGMIDKNPMKNCVKKMQKTEKYPTRKTISVQTQILNPKLNMGRVN